MKYDKLVRDRIPKIIEQNGQIPKTHICKSDEEYWEKLKDKLKEEVDEFLEDSEEGEIIDVLEVIDAIKEFKNFDENKIQELKESKKNKRGGFNKRIILDEVED